MARIEKLEWDTAHFGSAIGRMCLEKGDTLAGVRAKLARSGLNCIICRVSTDDLAGTNMLEVLGFQVKDTKIHLTMDLRKGHARPQLHRFNTRTYRPEELPEIRRISSSSFWSTHFHTDKRFRPKKVSEMYSRWIDNAVKEGCGITVAVRGSRVAGFLISKKEGRRFYIDLVATERSFRRKGVGEELVLAALRRASKRYKEGAIDVQLANVPAIRLYEKLGFRLASSEYTFHWWKD